MNKKKFRNIKNNVLTGIAATSMMLFLTSSKENKSNEKDDGKHKIGAVNPTDNSSVTSYVQKPGDFLLNTSIPEEKFHHNHTSTENDNPSSQTKAAIKEGVNWLANWYKERCNAGKVSFNEYTTAIEKLQQVKIYTTKQGTNRITEDLEKGVLHFRSDLLEQGATINGWKKFMTSKNTFPLGWCPREIIEEPVIIIDIDKINEKHGGKTSSITSTVIHELTHLTARVFNAEENVEQILAGKDISKRVQKRDSTNQVAPVYIDPVIITDTNTPLVIPPIDNAQELINSTTDKRCSFMNDGIPYSKYMDNPHEIYGRIMEMRYNQGWNGGENVEKTDLDKTNDDDLDIIGRYKKTIVTSILNDVADVPHKMNSREKDRT